MKKKLVSLISALVLSVASLSALPLAKVLAAAPYTCTWTGAGDGTSFSDASNWSGCNSAAPQAGDGDNLVFDTTSLSSDTTINNDISGLTVGSMTFQGSNSNYYDYTITGDAISLASGIVTDSGNDPTIDTNLTLSASQSLTGDGGIQFGDSSHSPTLSLSTYTLTIGSGSDTAYLSNWYGSLTGSGSIVVQKGAKLNLQSTSSGWSGTVSVAAQASLDTVPGGLGSGSSVTIQNGGSLCFAGFNGADFSPDITLGGTDALHASASCWAGGGYPIYESTASVKLTGHITLTANTTVDTTGTMTISGPITGHHKISLDNGEVGKLVIDSSDNQSSTPNGTAKAPVAVTTIAKGNDDPFAQPLIGGNEEYIIDGVRGETTVESGGILKGDGTVDGLAVEKGGTVAPGHSPGCLTVNGDLDEGGTYQAELGGTTACTGYDQLDVSGTVTLNNRGTPPSLGVLKISLVNGFKPKAGQTFEIINNKGGKAVSGTFSKLPQGSEITVSGYVFKISYKGGSGNDVVLSVVSVPKTPDTGLALVSAHPAMSILGAVMVSSGLLLGVAFRRKLLTRR